MRRFWLCAGANGKKDSLDWLRQAALARPPPYGVLFAGGIVNPSGEPGYPRLLSVRDLASGMQLA